MNTGGRQVPGQIVQPANTPRSYLVNTPSGQVRRNQRDLRVRSKESTDTELETRPRSVTTPSRSGITIRPPDRLTYYLKRGDVMDCICVCILWLFIYMCMYLMVIHIVWLL